jgi:hypothetical protein
MSENKEIKVDETIVKRLIRRILTKENEAIHKGTEANMPKQIREWIQEEVECSLNQ